MPAAAYGMKTLFWGPAAWVTLFSSVAGAYPVRVDSNNPEHVQTVRSFKNMIRALRHTLPCFWCRQSFAKYLVEMPLDDYDKTRHSMLKWLYIIHDKVNRKLIAQEKVRYKQESEKIKRKGLTARQTRQALLEAKEKILHTKPSPSFERVMAMYDRHRATAHKKI